ncbi:MAG: hypothetical protein H7288_10370 [Kineosporiaceae bacterium]|nr:hypothetical protein [Aeromicrobium sp.]
MSHLRTVFAALLLAAMTPLLTSGNPADAAGGACSSSSGVTVVVDFGSLGGGTAIRCAHTSGSGLEALNAAGFSTEGTQTYGASFVCRISGRPGPSSESCRSTPPTDTSWHYWYASNGGSWKFSQSGAANRTVIQGGFEGWSFGAGAAPGATPTRTGSSPKSPAGSDIGSKNSAPAVPTEPSSAKDTSLPKPKPRNVTAAPRSETTTTATRSVEANPAKSGTTGNSAAPWIAGGLILVLVAAVAVTQKRRSS